ncbi:MAG: xanthine dehydrogenase family protein subunit M [Elusimicrobiota bacterium]
MRGSAPSMKLLRPRTPREAVRAYGGNPDATPLAGGTDFMVRWNAGLLDDRTLLDLSALKAWTHIRAGRSGLRIGALATHSQLRDDPRIRRDYPLLAQACAVIGGEQIQNRGTLGGNIGNASPAGDTFTPLAVYEAVVRTVSPAGERTLPFLDVFAEVKKTTLRRAELISAVELPPAARPTRQLFRKVGTRAAQAISKLSAAGLLWLKRDGAVKELRFALGSVAPTVRRLATVESFLRGNKLTRAVIAEACVRVQRDISPIDDIRSTREYRLETSRRILRSFLE